MKLFEPALEWMAIRYQAAVAKELKKYGLRYEDLYDPLLDMVHHFDIVYAKQLQCQASAKF